MEAEGEGVAALSLDSDGERWTAPRHIPRPQAFDATVPHFYEAPLDHLDGFEGAPEVWCYTSHLTFAPGETVQFHVSTTEPTVEIEVVRDGLKPISVYRASGISAAHHPTPERYYATGCDWPVAHEWTIPDDLPSGFYLVLTRINRDGVRREYEHGFCVRATTSTQPFLFVLATSTWLAYSDWGGTNNYAGLDPTYPNGFSPRISIHKPWAKGMMAVPEGAPRKPHEYRPLPGSIPRYPPIEFAFTRGYSKFYASAGWATFDRLFARWAERHGYGLDFATQHDLHFRPEVLDGHRCIVTSGHDEYWSWEMRDAVDGFVEGGGKLARFGGNFASQIRLEDGGLTQVCYKEHAGKDPILETEDRHLRTSAWDDPAVGRPGAQTVGACAISGIYALVGNQAPRHSGAYTVYRPKHWALAGTDLAYGDDFGGSARIFGYEVDGLDYTMQNRLPVPTPESGALEGTQIIAMGLASIDEPDHGHKGTVRFYGEPTPFVGKLLYGDDATEDQVAGLNAGNGVIVSAPKGAGEIFCAGTCEWVNGLKLGEPSVEQITHNVLRRFGGTAD